MFEAKHASKVLWAKKPYSSKDDTGGWLSLQSHLKEVGEMAGVLWEKWLTKGVKKNIAEGISGEIDPKTLLILLAYLHDIGKASPSFQAMSGYVESSRIIHRSIEDAGLPINTGLAGKGAKHATVGYHMLVERGFDKSLAVVVGGHHGVYPGRESSNLYKGYIVASGTQDRAWSSVQDHLVNKGLEFAGVSQEHALSGVKIDKATQLMLTSIIIMADWLCSNEDFCPLVSVATYYTDASKRVLEAYNASGIQGSWGTQAVWEDIFERRFGFSSARPVQEAVLNIVSGTTEPGIVIVEAPMGCGKTEAALVAAEVLAEKTGRRGVYFALPTQATSNAMFKRVLKWLDTFENIGSSFGVKLAHGKAMFNDDYTKIRKTQKHTDIITDEGEPTNLVRQEWFQGRYKSLLTDFTVGTVDHLLMMGLKSKYVVLRHIGLANKVVVIDECHAYDTYMKSYLKRALSWLGAYRVPVVVLSATLPVQSRKELVQAYLGKRGRHLYKNPEWLDSRAYPCISYTDGDNAEVMPVVDNTENTTVGIEKLTDDALLNTVVSATAKGGCVGVIVNTVKRAQEIYDTLQENFGSECTRLLHSGFISTDRAEREAELLQMLGPPDEAKRPSKMVVVGTQIFEQSLDIDFDLIITDLSPMDLLIQRIGRLHRHKREWRPDRLLTPKCYVLNADIEKLHQGSVKVYGKYILMQTCLALPTELNLPQDIPEMVALVYGGKKEVPSKVLSAYSEAYKAWGKVIGDAEQRATTYQLSGPDSSSSTVYGWHEREHKIQTPRKDTKVGKVVADAVAEKVGEAVVRDGIGSIEVVLLRQYKGKLTLLPWILNGCEVEQALGDNEKEKSIAGCTLRLPTFMGLEQYESKIVAHLEQSFLDTGLVEKWQESAWLKGELPLILDENLECRLCGYVLKYDNVKGLQYRKEE